MENQFDDEETYQLRRKKRKKELKSEKQRQALIRQALKAGLAAILVLFILSAIIRSVKGKEMPKEEMVPEAEWELLASAEAEGQRVAESGPEGMDSEDMDSESEGDKSNAKEEYRARDYLVTEDTVELGEEIISKHAVFVDVEKGTVLAFKNAVEQIVPASMTKVLTVLVAAEHLDNLEDKFTITGDITDYCFVNGCSAAGFLKGETVTIRDLLYGAILPSGADAALGLAVYVSGSQEAFVELMNDKLEELGIAETAHFTNCVGIYEENHYCTVYDMAMIMEAAVQNEICREVLLARTFTTSETSQHPEGMLLSNWFVRRIEDKDTGDVAVYGKTGYVVQSDSCAVSYGIDRNGRKYIGVTTNADSRWRCIEDHAYMYKHFSAPV